jgi:hypothetical protein
LQDIRILVVFLLLRRELLFLFRFRPAVMDPICHFANLDLRFCVVKGQLSNFEARINLMVIKLWDDSITFNLEVMMVL